MSKLSVYSTKEAKSLGKLQRKKDKAVDSIVKKLNSHNITANHISLLSGAAAVSAAALAIYTGSLTIFTIGLVIHVVLDNLDGSLARLKPQKKYGVLADSIADHMGILSFSVIAALFTTTTPTQASLFAALYTVVVALALIKSYRNHPYRILLRPRPLVYATLVIDTFAATSLTSPAVNLSIAILIVFTTLGLLSFIPAYKSSF